MGIEEVQKINTLAKELLKHHIAESSEDAYTRAEMMVKGDAPKTEKEDEINKELRLIGLKMNSLYSELVNLQQEFKGFKEEMAYIKRKLQSEAFQSARGAQSAQAAQAETEATQAEETHETHAQKPHEAQQQKEQPKAAGKGSAVRPRTGDYQEKDVTVEKFFYFGTNKK
ncbi:hypothetical protein HYU15_04270 [Candidatus Woesearchaeota archaeon]|nr:hypothetical protein [Candidatus Woesearchaeota archaeon]